MYEVDTPRATEYHRLLEIWEDSVKATHHFLKTVDIEIIKSIIREKEVFNHVNITCARNSNNDIIGFIGVSDKSLEMLFVHSDFIGKGIGKLLLNYAIHELNITRVDVNEQNENALRFYEHFGFKVVSRSELDGAGKPYPILHMELT